jgi:hypothetical protein
MVCHFLGTKIKRDHLGTRRNMQPESMIMIHGTLARISECAHVVGISMIAYLKVHVDGPEDIPRSRSACHAERGQGLLLTYTRDTTSIRILCNLVYIHDTCDS